MKINALLTERAIIQEAILNNSTYREFHAMSKTLMLEYNMNQAQIQDVFKQVAQGAIAGGNVDKEGDAPASNRTVLGKGADAASYVADKYRGLKQYIGQTGPVKGLDAMIDNLQQQATAKFGGEAGQLSQSIEFYRELSKIPGMAMAVKFIIVSTAGLLTGGVGAIAIAAGLTAANKMLQGDKFSSAVMSSMETAGTVAAIQTAKDLLTTTRVGADYGNADDQSFGPISKTPDPNDLTGVDPNNIYRPTPTDAAPAGPSDAANAAYNQNPDPSTGLPLDPNSTRADYTTPDATPGADDAVSTASEYKVTAADGKLGVGGIAQKYPGISVQDIIDYNNLSPDGLIKPGQVLQIPEPNLVSPASTNIYDRFAGSSPTQDMDAVSDRANNIFKAQDAADAEYYKNKPDDFGINPTSNDAVGDGMPKAQPVAPGTPSDGSYRQSAPLGADGKPMKQMASKINTGNMIREYIDIDTTARMWILRESLGKPRGNVYLTNEGVRAVFKEVARRSAVNEGPMLDRLRGFNQKANAFVGKAIAPIKQAASAGWSSATNKITYGDLDMNWRRSAKLGSEESVDSAEVAKFLTAQGVKAPLITASFKALGLQEPGQATATTDTTTAGGVAAQGGGFLGGLAKGLGAPGVAKDIEAFNASTGGNGTRRSTTTTGAAGPAQGTTTAEPAQDTTATGATAPTATGTTAKLPTATSSTAGQPSKVSYDPKMFAKKTAAPNFNALSTAASQGYKTAQPTAAPTATDATPTDTTTAKTRTGGKVAGQVSQTPNAIRKRAARAGTDSTSAPSAFGNMAAQLAARPTTSSTGGTTTGVAGAGNGVVSHTANPNNPNRQAATTTKTTAPTFTGRQPQSTAPKDARFPNGKYDGVTGETTPEWQAELDKQDAAEKANMAATQKFGAPPATSTKPAANKPTARVPQTNADMDAAEKSQLAKMKSKNPKLAAMTQQLDDMNESRVDFGAMLFNRMKSGR